MTLYWAFILDLLSPQKSIVFHYRVWLGHWSVNELLQLLYKGEPDQSIAADKRKTRWQPWEQVRTQICTSVHYPRRLRRGHFQDVGHMQLEKGPPLFQGNICFCSPKRQRACEPAKKEPIPWHSVFQAKKGRANRNTTTAMSSGAFLRWPWLGEARLWAAAGTGHSQVVGTHVTMGLMLPLACLCFNTDFLSNLSAEQKINI